MGERFHWRRLAGSFAILLVLTLARAIIEHPAILGWDTRGFVDYTWGFIVAVRHWPFTSPTPSSTGDA